LPRALVTGATGLVGSHIAEQLKESGCDVRALVRRPSRWLTSIGAEQTVGDVLDAAALTEMRLTTPPCCRAGGIVSLVSIVSVARHAVSPRLTRGGCSV